MIVDHVRELFLTHYVYYVFFPPYLSNQDSSQIELLKELMDLQKDMVVMLLSMLEGRHAAGGGVISNNLI